MMNQSVELIVTKIEELIVAAGGKVEAFYPYVVKQQIISALCLLFLVVVTIFLFGVSIKLVKKRGYDCVYMSIEIMLGIFLFIFGIIFICEGLPRLFNPDYYAVKDILEMGGELIGK